jgi:hypothetical protein
MYEQARYQNFIETFLGAKRMIDAVTPNSSFIPLCHEFF